MLTQMQLYDAIDETPGIADNIIRLLSRRIRELNQKLNAKEAVMPPTETARVAEMRWRLGIGNCVLVDRQLGTIYIVGWVLHTLQ